MLVQLKCNAKLKLASPSTPFWLKSLLSMISTMSFLEEFSLCVHHLDHPNIVHFYGLRHPPGSAIPLLVMELMDTCQNIRRFFCA